MLAVALTLVLSADASACEVFRIERSKNANVVLYEAEGGLERDAPVKASWLLLAQHGQRQTLTFFERLMAYGFEVRALRDGASRELRLKALKDRALRLVKRGACLAAVGVIDGAEAVLQRVYVTTDERGAVPRVLSVELFGVDLATGAPRVERLTR